MSEKELQELEYFAAQLYPTETLARLLGADMREMEAELIAGKSDRALAIIKGRMSRETAIRQSILDSAVNGSSPAQTMAMEMLKGLQ